jgi:hypothetical protein
MRQLVPASLVYDLTNGATPAGDHSHRVNFQVLSVNLEFVIEVPDSTQISDLALFIRMWIMHPLVSYARLSKFEHLYGQVQLARMGLALKSAPRSRLNDNLTVGQLQAGECLVALVDVQWLAAMELCQDQIKARLTLTWQETPRDLDLHLVPLAAADDSAHVSFANPGTLESAPWARLNVDIRTGFGPEVISISGRAKGAFLVLAHNYSGEIPLRSSRASLIIEIGGRLQRFDCPCTGDGDVWKICVVDCTTSTVESINLIVYDLPHRAFPRRP